MTLNHLIHTKVQKNYGHNGNYGKVQEVRYTIVEGSLSITMNQRPVKFTFNCDIPFKKKPFVRI